MPFIYLAVWKTGTTYVGQTLGTLWQLKARYRRYCHKPSERPSEALCFAHGMPTLKILEECPAEKLDAREGYWMIVYPSSTNRQPAHLTKAKQDRLNARIEQLLREAWQAEDANE